MMASRLSVIWPSLDLTERWWSASTRNSTISGISFRHCGPVPEGASWLALLDTRYTGFCAYGAICPAMSSPDAELPMTITRWFLKSSGRR